MIVDISYLSKEYLVMLTSGEIKSPTSDNTEEILPLSSNGLIPQYAQITNDLKQQILVGKLLPGSKLPTEAELSRLYGTSRITIRRVLQELQQQNLIIGHQGKGTFVNNSETARSLNVLFIHSNESDASYPYTSLILDGLHKFGQKSSPMLRIELVSMPAPDNQSPDDTRIEELVRYGQCSGVITMPRIRPEAMQRLTQSGIPVVMIGGLHYLKAPKDVILVGSDVEAVSNMHFKHLKSIGRTRIGAIIGNIRHSSMVYSRLSQSASRVGLKFEPAQFDVSDWGINSGTSAIERLLQRIPDLDAVFAADDLIALGILHYLWKQGIRVPEDIAVLGNGNQLGEHSHSGLSTIDLHLRQQGFLSGEYLLRRISGLPVKRLNLIPPTLLRRSTT